MKIFDGLPEGNPAVLAFVGDQLWAGYGLYHSKRNPGLSRLNVFEEEPTVALEKKFEKVIVYSICTTPWGMVFIGTDHGLFNYRVDADKFQLVRGISEKPICAMTATKDLMLIGAHDEVIILDHKMNLRRFHIEGLEITSLAVKNFGDTDILFVCSDTSRNGLSAFPLDGNDIEVGSVTEYDYPYVYSIFRWRDTLAVCSTDGVFTYHDEEDARGLHIGNCFCACELSDKSLLVGGSKLLINFKSGLNILTGGTLLKIPGAGYIYSIVRQNKHVALTSSNQIFYGAESEFVVPLKKSDPELKTLTAAARIMKLAEVFRHKTDIHKKKC